jgi:group I intron endonuclease
LSFKKRWRSHLYELRRGEHHCSGLQNAFNKYGEQALVFSKIAIVHHEQLSVREQEQIDSRPRKMIYNIALFVGKPNKGRKVSEATRAKLRACKAHNNPHKGKPKSAEQRKKIADSMRGRKRGPYSPRPSSKKPLVKKTRPAKKVICVETGEAFVSLAFAADAMKRKGNERACQQNIRQVCDGLTKKAYGYTWRFVDDSGNCIPPTRKRLSKAQAKFRAASKNQLVLL